MTRPSPPTSRRHPFHAEHQPVRLALVLGALTAMGPFTMDLYLPAFPRVLADLHTSTAAVQATLTATAIGMGIGQLVVGPLSDARGRRWPLLASVALHVVASLLVALAPSIELVTVARFGQGFGAAAGAVVTSAMIRDLYSGRRFVGMIARIALVSGLAPVIAPVIGSQLLAVTSWRGVFSVLAAFGAIVLIAVALFVPETLRTGHASDDPRRVRDRLSVLARDRQFVGAVGISSLVFACIVTFLSAAPFVFQDGFGFSPQQFGLLFAVDAVGLPVCTQLSARLLRRLRPARLLAVGLPVMTAAGAAIVIAGVTGSAWFAVAIPCGLVVAMQGFCGPCVQVLLLERHRAESGTAVAVAGFTNSIVGGGLSLLPALLGGVTPAALGTVLLLSAGAAIAVLATVVRPGHSKSLVMTQTWEAGSA